VEGRRRRGGWGGGGGVAVLRLRRYASWEAGLELEERSRIGEAGEARSVGRFLRGRVAGEAMQLCGGFARDDWVAGASPNAGTMRCWLALHGITSHRLIETPGWDHEKDELPENVVLALLLPVVFMQIEN